VGAAARGPSRLGRRQLDCNCCAQHGPRPRPGQTSRPPAPPRRRPTSRSYRALNIQAGTTFCDTAFEAEVASGRLKGGTLDKYTCVALAGVVTEYLRFGQAEGGVGDVAQLDRLFGALQVCVRVCGGGGGLLRPGAGRRFLGGRGAQLPVEAPESKALAHPPTPPPLNPPH
jgi:hypothetical protein